MVWALWLSGVALLWRSVVVQTEQARRAKSNPGKEFRGPSRGHTSQFEGTLSGGIHSLRSGQALPTTAKYVWEGNGYYSPLIYSMLGGAWRYHLYDGLGSTRQLMLHASPYTVTDATLRSSQSMETGAAMRTPRAAQAMRASQRPSLRSTSTYSYEAFGNLMASTGTTANPYKYVGSLGYYQIYPPQAGGANLMHLGARYYMPEAGRFTAPDPARPLLHALSQYAYCDSHVPSYVDADGEQRLPFPLDLNQYENWVFQRLIGDPLDYLYGLIPEDPLTCVRRVRDEECKEHKKVYDRWQHCNVTCEISRKCLGGVWTGAAAGIWKELRDVFGAGDADWNDLGANRRGFAAARWRPL